MANDAHFLTMPALGRVAYLGDLYDGRTDTFAPSVNAFNSSLESDEINVLKMNSVDIKFNSADSLLDKLDSLNISGSLSLSLLAGMIKASGSCSYLNEEKKSYREANFNLTYTYKSEHHQLRDLSLLIKGDEKNKKAGKVNGFENILWETVKPTHVVVGITWGASFNINCVYANKEDKDKNEIKADFDLTISKGSVEVTGKAKGEKKVELTDQRENMTFNADCDVYDVSKQLPNDFDEAKAMAIELPNFVKNVNDGKGIPISYILMPCDILAKLLKSQAAKMPLLKEIKEDVINASLKKVQHATELIQRLNDLYDDMLTEMPLFKGSLEKVKFEQLLQLSNHLHTTKSEFGKQLIYVRKGDSESKVLVEFLEAKLDKEQMETTKKNFWSTAYDYFDEWQKEIKHKINFVKILRRRQIPFLDTTQSLQNLLIDCINERLAIFYLKSYKEYTELGEECVRKFSEFFKACKDLSKVDDEKPYFVVDGELHTNAASLLLTGSQETTIVDVIYFDSTGMTKSDAEKYDWKTELKCEIDKKKKAEEMEMEKNKSEGEGLDSSPSPSLFSGSTEDD